MTIEELNIALETIMAGALLFFLYCYVGPFLKRYAEKTAEIMFQRKELQELIKRSELNKFDHHFNRLEHLYYYLVNIESEARRLTKEYLESSKRVYTEFKFDDECRYFARMFPYLICMVYNMQPDSVTGFLEDVSRGLEHAAVIRDRLDVLLRLYHEFKLYKWSLPQEGYLPELPENLIDRIVEDIKNYIKFYKKYYPRTYADFKYHSQELKNNVVAAAIELKYVLEYLQRMKKKLREEYLRRKGLK